MLQNQTKLSKEKDHLHSQTRNPSDSWMSMQSARMPERWKHSKST